MNIEELKSDAKDFLSAIEGWKDRELKDGFPGHKITEMRPILIAKRICNKIIAATIEEDQPEQLTCDCQDFENGLVSNYCPIHNERPFKPE